MSRILKYSAALVVTLLFAIAVKAGPESLIHTQPVELIEMIKPGQYTQRTVNIQFVLDGTATVCVRGLDWPKDSSKAKCFYRLIGSTEVVVVEVQIIGEVKA